MVQYNSLIDFRAPLYAIGPWQARTHSHSQHAPGGPSGGIRFSYGEAVSAAAAAGRPQWVRRGWLWPQGPAGAAQGELERLLASSLVRRPGRRLSTTLHTASG
eukprot:7383150-Prymnesium_polylepis.1